MRRWTNGLPGATARLGAMMTCRGLSLSQCRMRADTHPGPGGEQCLEGAGVGLPREQMVTINEIEQRHGLSAQGMDDVSIIDDVAMLVGSLRRPTAPQREERGGA